MCFVIYLILSMQLIIFYTSLTGNEILNIMTNSPNNKKKHIIKNAKKIKNGVLPVLLCKNKIYLISP